jgi:hypothetical protein
MGQREQDMHALLIINGGQYAHGQYAHGTPERRADHREKTRRLHETINQQLKKCPRSVIIINDIQSMMPEVVMDLAVYFNHDGLVRDDDGTSFATSEALFLLSSDFMEEDQTRGLSPRELIAKTEEYWKDIIRAKPTFHSYINHVPFVSLEAASFRKLLIKQMRDTLACSPRYKAIQFEDDVVDFLVDKWATEYRALNGRAHDKIIMDWVQPALQDLELDAAGGVRVGLEVDPISHEIQAKVFRTLAKDEV